MRRLGLGFLHEQNLVHQRGHAVFVLASLKSILMKVRTTMSPRNELGQFEKGVSGNPNGRPRKEPHPISDIQHRRDFFDIMEMLVPVNERGKRKMVPVRVAIGKQLALKAAAGDMSAIREVTKWQYRYAGEYSEQQMSMVRVVLDGEDRIRKFPDDVTDEFKRAISMLRLQIELG
jgi:hypothetical protein